MWIACDSLSAGRPVVLAIRQHRVGVSGAKNCAAGNRPPIPRARLVQPRVERVVAGQQVRRRPKAESTNENLKLFGLVTLDAIEPRINHARDYDTHAQQHDSPTKDSLGV
jgi:hypothetical protein